MAWGLLGETLGVFQIVGGLLVLSGALLAQTATASARPEPAPELEQVTAAGERRRRLRPGRSPSGVNGGVV